MGLKSNQKMATYSHNICATIAPIYLAASLCCWSQDLQLYKIGDYISPYSVQSTFQHHKWWAMGIKLLAVDDSKETLSFTYNRNETYMKSHKLTTLQDPYRFKTDKIPVLKSWSVEHK